MYKLARFGLDFPVRQDGEGGKIPGQLLASLPLNGSRGFSEKKKKKGGGLRYDWARGGDEGDLRLESLQRIILSGLDNTLTEIYKSTGNTEY